MCGLGGTIVEVDPATGRAVGIRRLLLREDDVERLEMLSTLGATGRHAGRTWRSQ